MFSSCCLKLSLPGQERRVLAFETLSRPGDGDEMFMGPALPMRVSAYPMMPEFEKLISMSRVVCSATHECQPRMVSQTLLVRSLRY
jgi:hypothetical protein